MLYTVYLIFVAPARGDGMACYHNPCDSIDVMITEDNMNFLGKTADTVAQSLHSLSEPHKSTSGKICVTWFPLGTAYEPQFPTMWYVRPAKIQARAPLNTSAWALRICACMISTSIISRVCLHDCVLYTQRYDFEIRLLYLLL